MKKIPKNGLAFYCLTTHKDLLGLLEDNNKATTIEELKAINNELIKLVGGVLSFTSAYLDPKGKLKFVNPSDIEANEESTQD